ncbi:MAG: tocopherol cyclase family protein [Acidobacteria bacterium]|nr:tocopherol cyclase family protein [Acidobacteriota bacterium]
MNLDQANALRWTAAARGSYEVYYLTLNDLASETGYWIRYVLQAPETTERCAELGLWFAFFDRRNPERSFGVFERRPLATLESQATPFRLGFGGGPLDGHNFAPAELGNGLARGGIGQGGRRVRWHLEWPAESELILPFPEGLYSSGDLPGAMIYPYPGTEFAGTIEIGDRRLVIEGAPGEQSHIWGRKHPPHWLWAHCNRFDDDPDGYLEVSCIPASADGPPPVHMLIARVRGREVRLIAPLDGSAATSGSVPGRWSFAAESERERVELEVNCPLKLILEAPYIDPDGSSCFCLHSDLASCRLRLLERVGRSGDDSEPEWENAGELSSEGWCHVEWGDWHEHPEVDGRIERVGPG